MLQAVIYYIITVILTKELVIATDQCTEYQFKSPFSYVGESCGDIYNKNPESHQCSGYYWIVKRVFCGMTYTGSSCEHIYNKYPEIYKNNPKEKSGYYRLNNKQWTYCNMTEIAANDDDFTSTCAAVEVIKSTYQSFLPSESCESIYNNNAESYEWSGYYWITSSRVYCGMNYTGSSCEDIYNNNPETGDKSGYYRINNNQWTYCNMTALADDNFISTCAGVGGGWRRIVNINISAGDDCPGEWRKATQSNVSFCREASGNNVPVCSSASFSTNGISYQRVCGRARGYQKGHTLGFYGSHPGLNITMIDQSYVSGLSITYSNNPRKHIWTFASGFSERNNRYSFNCPCSIYPGYDPPSFVGNNYYCESGSVDRPDTRTYYFNDPLWDGAGCTGGSSCCDDTTQPWFYHQLNQTTQDDIEARICTRGYFVNRLPLIDQLELYVQ